MYLCDSPGDDEEIRGNSMHLRMYKLEWQMGWLKKNKVTALILPDGISLNDALKLLEIDKTGVKITLEELY